MIEAMMNRPELATVSILSLRSTSAPVTQMLTTEAMPKTSSTTSRESPWSYVSRKVAMYVYRMLWAST